MFISPKVWIRDILTTHIVNDTLKNDLLFSPYHYSNNKKWWILLTHGFIHADFLHLFFNMYVLYIFGPSLESYFLSSSEIGWIYYISFYQSNNQYQH